MEKKSLASEYPDIAKEWHPTKNGDLSPESITPKNGRKVWWRGTCGHEWMATVSHRTDGQGCPVCSNHKLLSGFNDLATKYPNLAEEWHPTKNGALLPSDVFPMSNRKVWWLGRCGHEWQVAISCRTKNNNGCPICSGYIIQTGINDLKTLNPALAAEWVDENNIGLSPTTISANTHKKVWWICPKCGNRWKADIHHRNSGVGCPKCGRQAATDTRINNALSNGHSLAIVNPAVALEWHPSKNGMLSPDKFLPSSNMKVWWRCKKGHDWEATIASRNDGHRCPICDFEKKSSFPEQAVLYYFSKHIEAQNRSKVFGKEIDIYFPTLKTGIEYDGRYYHKSEKSKERDLIKTHFLAEKGVRLIRIKEGYSNLIEKDVVTFRYDAKYSELSWAIQCVAQIIGFNDPFDIDLDRDQFCIFEQYIQAEKENSLVALFPTIAKQWHPTKNGTLTPDLVSFGSQKRVWWLGACGHEWQSTVSSRTNQNKGCPVCSGNLIVAGLNDLLTNNPSLAAEWDYENNSELKPSELSPYSHKKVWWKCSNCGNSWQAVVKNRTYGAHCPICSRNNRKNNIAITL